MPYTRKGKCVYKQNSDGSAGEKVGCSDTEELAKSHLAALYANTTKEVSAVPSTTSVHGPGGILSAPGQGSIKQGSGKKKAKKKMLTPKELKAQYLSEKDAFSAASDTWDVDGAASAIQFLASLLRSEAYQDESADTVQLLGILKELGNFLSGEIDEIYVSLAQPGISYKETNSKFLSTKEGEHYRWTQITASAFKDRDQEIIAEKAFVADCDEMELTGDYGELLWWHCDGELHENEKEARPYLPLGICDTSLVFEKLNIESGLYYDNEVGKLFTEKSADFGASKSFWHLEGEPKDGVYSYIRTKERSLLPRTKESNLLTRLFGHKEKEMATNQERIAALKEKLGKQGDPTFDAAKDMSEKASKFLASKEAKVKTDAADAEDKKDGGADEGEEDAQGKKTKAKEVEAMELVLKEQSDKFTLALKERDDRFEEVLKTFTEKQSADISVIQTELAQMQVAYGELMGIQPKSVFKASEKGKTVSKEAMTAEQQKAAEATDKAAGTGDGYLNMVDFIISGERPVAA